MTISIPPTVPATVPPTGTPAAIPAQPTDRAPLTVVRDLPEVVRTDEMVVVKDGPVVRIGPFSVVDSTEEETVDALVAGALSVRARSRAFLAYALHVGGLNARRSADFVQAMSRSDVVYADGMSVVLLARLGGAERIERCGTTDIGWKVLTALGHELGRPVRVALIGGPDGLTRRAGRVLADAAGVEVVMTEHGYHDDWTAVLAELALSQCDVLFVGLGAPFEMTWTEAQRDRLPPCLVMTCGGWFGFITEDEKRAPAWVCRIGLEWTYRLGQAPGRLWRRYATGAVSTGLIAWSMRLSRPREADTARIV